MSLQLLTPKGSAFILQLPDLHVHSPPLAFCSCKQQTALLPFGGCELSEQGYTRIKKNKIKATVLKQPEPSEALSAVDVSPSFQLINFMSRLQQLSSAPELLASTWQEAGNTTTRPDTTASRSACATTSSLWQCCSLLAHAASVRLAEQ